MALETIYIEEPNLFFGGDQTAPHPQVGLLNFGPHGGGEAKHQHIRVGVIGSDLSVLRLRRFLAQLQVRIRAEEKPPGEYQDIDFPGLGVDRPLGFEMHLDENCVSVFEKGFIERLETEKDRFVKCGLLRDEYVRLINEMRGSDPLPKVLLLPLDERVIHACRAKGIRGDKIVFERRSFGHAQGKTVPFYDFHDFIKAVSAQSAVPLPTQLLTPGTLVFSDSKDHPAKIAWNFSVAVYYKATGIPWKLADLDETTCHVGLNFYQDFLRDQAGTMRTSVAQVYMRTGESQVIQGRPFAWDEDRQGRDVHLNEASMTEIVQDSVALFSSKNKAPPRRFVIHKTSSFDETELGALEAALPGSTEIDAVQIRSFPGFRVYTVGHIYPVVRGTAIIGGTEAILFTTGYIPVLRTYPGPTVPRPVHLLAHRLDSSMDRVCRDIIGLTKLDWNSTSFANHAPATIGVAAKVGGVLAEMAGGNPPPPSYRFYM